AGIVAEDDTSPAHWRYDIRLLHQLATRRAAKTGEMAGGILLRRTHVEAIGRAPRIRQQERKLIIADTLDTGALRQTARVGREITFCSRSAPRLSVLQIEAGQRPAD